MAVERARIKPGTFLSNNRTLKLVSLSEGIHGLSSREDGAWDPHSNPARL